MKKIALGIASALLFFAFPASATIIRVPQDQPTIQAGINAGGNSTIKGSKEFDRTDKFQKPGIGKEQLK